VVLDNVEPGSIVSTDELMSYGLLTGDGYKHGMVKHGSKEWSYYDYRHDAVHNTNRVESFWRLFKKSVASTHIHISAKYADRYLDEFAFRSNHRVMGNAMFNGERDVRSSDRGALTALTNRLSNSARSIEPTPRASSWATKSLSRPVLIASAKDNMFL